MQRICNIKFLHDVRFPKHFHRTLNAFHENTIDIVLAAKYFPVIDIPIPHIVSYRKTLCNATEDPTQHPYYAKKHESYRYFMNKFDITSKTLCNANKSPTVHAHRVTKHESYLSYLNKFDITSENFLHAIADNNIKEEIDRQCHKHRLFQFDGSDEKTAHYQVLTAIKQDPVMINRCDIHEISLLYRAIYYEMYGVIELLIGYGANINQQYEMDISLLHLAVMKGNTTMVKFLLDAGIDKEIKNVNGNDAYNTAKMLLAQLIRADIFQMIDRSHYYLVDDYVEIINMLR